MNGTEKQSRPEAPLSKTAKVGSNEDLQSDEARRNLYRKATDYLSVVMTAVRNDQSFELDPGYTILERIVDIRTPMDALFLKSIHSDESYDFVVNHSVNVAIYAIKMAESLGYSRERQIEMGMVGLFHDIGMAKMPDEIIYKAEKLNDREFHLIKERPKLGYEILRQFGEDYAYLAECTLQIYERVDGSGYPRGLKVDEIHDYAQIIGLVDMYEALIHTRPQREKILHYYAVKEIIRSGKRQFQQRYLKALLNTFSIFPLQSYVKLNSKAIGRVIETYQDQPMRPKLQIVYDSQRKRVLTERIINLPEHSLLYITDAVSEEDLLAIAEESYLATKPVSFETVKPGEEILRKPLTDGSAGGVSVAGPVVDKGRDSDKSVFSGSAVRKIILVFALLLIAAGALWQFLSAQNGQMAAPRTVVEKDNTAGPGHAAQQPLSVKAESVRPVLESAGMNQGALDAETNVAQPNDSQTVAASQVETSVSEPPIPPAVFETANPPSSAYPYSLRLTYFRSQEKAADVVSFYRESGIDAHWVKVDLGSKGIWYRVFGGHFDSESEAQAFMAEEGLTGAVVKPTRYANWIGASKDRKAVLKSAGEIDALGFSSYVIAREDGRNHLYIGAFYTKAGAQAQYEELIGKGIENQIVER